MQLPNILLQNATVKMPLMELPLRTTAVKLAAGVVLISPGPDIEKEAETLQQFGHITDIIAPNLFHHLNIQKARELYPMATLWGAPGLQKKRSDIHWQKIFGETNWPYNHELKAIVIEGIPKLNEVVFYHEQSRTLITTDLFFNLSKPQGVGSWFVLRMFGTYKKFAISRLIMMAMKDRKKMKESLHQLMTLEIENIIMAHGEVIIGNGKQFLTNALRERDLL